MHGLFKDSMNEQKKQAYRDYLTPRQLRIAPEITSYSWKIYEHPDVGIAL